MDRIGHKVPAPWPSSVVPLRAFPLPPFSFFLLSLLFGEGGRYCSQEKCIFGTVVERECAGERRWFTDIFLVYVVLAFNSRFAKDVDVDVGWHGWQRGGRKEHEYSVRYYTN